MTKKFTMPSLSGMSGIRPQTPEDAPPAAPPAPAEPAAATPEPEPEPERPPAAKPPAKSRKKQEKLVTVNIKIAKTQKDWLGKTAARVRENNADPVPPSDRVYPQHLIGVAIDLLKDSNVDWAQIRNVDELREQLNL